MVPLISGMSAPQVVSGASGYSSPSVKMGNLFQQIDPGNTGSISKSQFQQAFATMNPPGRFKALGASAIFNKLDPNQTGAVSKTNFVNGMTSIMKSFGPARPPRIVAPSATSSSQTLNDSLQSFLQMGSKPSTANGSAGSIVDTLA